MNTTTQRLTPVPFAATVKVPGPCDELRPWFVMHRCPSRAKAYYCLPCDRHLNDAGALAEHCDDGRHHTIVIWCQQHGVYEEADAQQLAALEGRV